MHRNYQEWEEASYKTWGPVTIQEAVEDIHELIHENDQLRRESGAGISIGGHYLTGKSSAINAVENWYSKALTYDDTVEELRRRVKELEDGSRVRDLENKAIQLSVKLTTLQRQVRLEGELP